MKKTITNQLIFCCVLAIILYSIGHMIGNTYWQTTIPFFIGWFGCMIWDIIFDKNEKL